jgi:hypothetical protein
MSENGMRRVRSATGIDTVLVDGEVVHTGGGGCVDVYSGALATTRGSAA